MLYGNGENHQKKHQIWTETTVIVASSADLSLNAWTGDMRVIWFLNCYGSLSARIALNINVWTKSGTSSLLSTVISRQLTFLGHILRMEKDESAIKDSRVV